MRAARCSSCAPILFRRKFAACFMRCRARGAARQSRNAGRADQSCARTQAGSRATAAKARAAGRRARSAPAASRDGILQRAWRLHEGRPRISDRSSKATSARRRRGSMSSPTRHSAFRFPPTAAASPGRSTASRTSSRRGRTIPSAMRPAKRSMCATRTPAKSGGRRALPIREKTRVLFGAARTGLQPLRT